MRHVFDDLELYVLGVLPPASRAEVDSHLVACADCRAEAAALSDVLSAIHESLPEREPSLGLRDRILTSARPARPSPIAWLRPSRAWLPAAALAAAITLAVMSVGWKMETLRAEHDASLQQMETLRAERDASLAIAQRVSHGGRNWHMNGVDRWKGAGGMLFVPQSSPAYVVFHDLPAVPSGYNYTIWLVDADGRWIRGSSFAPTDSGVRMVDVGVPVEGFDQCAVTLETQTQGKRAGPIVMQSRFY